jgi:hypothetical protein
MEPFGEEWLHRLPVEPGYHAELANRWLRLCRPPVRRQKRSGGSGPPAGAGRARGSSRGAASLADKRGNRGAGVGKPKGRPARAAPESEDAR